MWPWTLTVTHDLGLGFSRSYFEIAVSQELRGLIDRMERMWVDRKLDPLYDFELWPHPLTLNFQEIAKFGEWELSWFGMKVMWPWMDDANDLKKKGYEVTGWCLHCVNLILDLIRHLDIDFQGQILKNNHISGSASDISLAHDKIFFVLVCFIHVCYVKQC